MNPVYKPYWSGDGIQVYNADCIPFLKTLPSKSIGACITDPPYNLGKSFANDRQEDIAYEQWCREWFQEVKRVTAGPILLTCGMKNLGMWHRIEQPKWVLCWWKPGCAERCPVGSCNWEPILLYGGWKGTNGCDVLRTTENSSLATDNRVNPIAHPTSKVVEWAKVQVSKFTKHDEIVLDPFLGSGTIAIACYHLQRKCVGVEVSKDYCALAGKRIDAARGGDFIKMVRRAAARKRK